MSMGLAREMEWEDWALDPHLETTLRRMGERGDIIRTMQREFGETREYRMFDPSGSTQSVTGRVASKGLADEMADQGPPGRRSRWTCTLHATRALRGACKTFQSARSSRLKALPSQGPLITRSLSSANRRYDTQRHLAISDADGTRGPGSNCVRPDTHPSTRSLAPRRHR